MCVLFQRSITHSMMRVFLNPVCSRCTTALAFLNPVCIHAIVLKSQTRTHTLNQVHKMLFFHAQERETPRASVRITRSVLRAHIQNHAFPFRQETTNQHEQRARTRNLRKATHTYTHERTHTRTQQHNKTFGAEQRRTTVLGAKKRKGSAQRAQQNG